MLKPFDLDNRPAARSDAETLRRNSDGPAGGVGTAEAASTTSAGEDMPRKDGHGRIAAPGGDNRAPHPLGCEGLAERDRMARARETSAGWSHDWLQLRHELRTPLNAILGNIELLLDGSAGPLAAPARACIGDIQMASRQLLKQVQPLLLLVQARTSGAIATRMPLDLLALVRQASAEAADAAGTVATDPACGDACDEPGLTIAGDPVWLGALAAALVALHDASPANCGPVSIAREGDGGTAGCGDAYVILRVWWDGLDPAAASPLPLALIDAVANLHGGRIVSLCRRGLRLQLPADVAA